MPRWLSPVERLPRKQQAAGAKPARGSNLRFSGVYLRCAGSQIDLLIIAIAESVRLREGMSGFVVWP